MVSFGTGHRFVLARHFPRAHIWRTGHLRIPPQRESMDRSSQQGHHFVEWRNKPLEVLAANGVTA
jgi:hypothetical protein